MMCTALYILSALIVYSYKLCFSFISINFDRKPAFEDTRTDDNYIMLSDVLPRIKELEVILFILL